MSHEEKSTDIGDMTIKQLISYSIAQGHSVQTIVMGKRSEIEGGEPLERHDMSLILTLHPEATKRIMEAVKKETESWGSEQEIVK